MLCPAHQRGATRGQGMNNTRRPVPNPNLLLNFLQSVLFAIMNSLVPSLKMMNPSTMIVSGRSAMRPNHTLQLQIKNQNLYPDVALKNDREEDDSKNEEVTNDDELSKLHQALHETAVQRTKESNEILECFEDTNRQLLLVEGSCGGTLNF
jgi:hypothetical protein